MPPAATHYTRFLGSWQLIPESCDYEQGEAPRAGTYRIREVDTSLHFEMEWEDASGSSERAEFSGVPDGKPAPFAGGDLADALRIDAVSERELNTSALYKGAERLVAQRQLDATGDAMRVVQVVRLPGGEQLTNISIYRRSQD